MMRTVSEFIDHIENCGLRIAFQLEKFLHPQRPDFGEDDVSLIEAVVDQRKTPVVNIMASQNVRHAIILADYDFKSDAFILKDSEKTHSTAESHNVEDEYIIKKPLTQKVKLRFVCYATDSKPGLATFLFEAIVYSITNRMRDSTLHSPPKLEIRRH